MVINGGVRRFALAAAVLSVVGCTSANNPQGGRSATPRIGASSPGPSAASGCPVTRATARAMPPRSADVSGLKPVPYVYDWFGNVVLWVRLPLRGDLPAWLDPTLGRLATKFPWWRAIPGALTITGQRLDGPTGGFRGNPGTVASYGPVGFDPSYLVWPSPGCWRVTGTVAHHSLTIVVRVQAQR